MAGEGLKMFQSLLGEMVASFVFGFTVYSAILGSAVTDQKAGPVIVGLAVGFSGVAVIYAFCDVAAAHFNPAITLAAIVTGKLRVVQGLGYIAAQYIGFILAVCALLPCSPKDYAETLKTIIATPASAGGDNLTVFAAEFLLTAILVHVAFAVGINPYTSGEEGEGKSQSPDESEPVYRRVAAPLCIGLTLGFLAFLGIASSGGVFNPGIALAPMLMSNTWTNFWVYLSSQYSGGLVGALLQVFVLYKLG